MNINWKSRRACTSNAGAMRVGGVGRLLTAILLPWAVATAAWAQAPLSSDVSAANLSERLAIPSDSLRAPYPPAGEGCRSLEGDHWVEFPCTTEQDKQAHYFPPPVVGDSIQSLPVSRGDYRGRVIATTTPFVWGSVSAGLTHPKKATEVDSSGASDAFSIQNNTNTFICTTCKKNYPFAEESGVAVSASKSGDQGWVQFVVQTDSAGSRICVWNVDATVAGNTLPQRHAGVVNAGYEPKCADVPTTTPLTGKSSVGGTAEVIGYINCPNADSNTDCLLSVLVYLPWAGESGKFLNVQAKDLMGLAGQWTNINGGMVGMGGGSKATFYDTNVTLTERVYTCEQPALFFGYLAPVACADPDPGITSGPLASPYELRAEAINSDTTGESNNLTNGPATLTCDPFDCELSFTATAP